MELDNQQQSAKFPPRGYVSKRKEDDGLTHIILWQEYADKPSEPYISLREAEAMVAEARALHTDRLKRCIWLAQRLEFPQTGDWKKEYAQELIAALSVLYSEAARKEAKGE